MNPVSDLIPKAFTSPVLHREAIALTAGILTLVVADIILKPDLAAIPNWNEMNSLGSTFIFLTIAFATGQIILLMGWMLHDLLRKELIISMPTRGCIGRVWSQYFTFRPKLSIIGPDQISSQTLNLPVRRFILEHPGLTAELMRHQSRMYFIRVLSVISLLVLCAVTFQNGADCIATPAFWFGFGGCLFLSRMEMDAMDDVNKFQFDIACLYERERAAARPSLEPKPENAHI